MRLQSIHQAMDGSYLQYTSCYIQHHTLPSILISRRCNRYYYSHTRERYVSLLLGPHKLGSTSLQVDVQNARLQWSFAHWVSHSRRHSLCSFRLGLFHGSRNRRWCCHGDAGITDRGGRTDIVDDIFRKQSLYASFRDDTLAILVFNHPRCAVVAPLLLLT